MKKMNWVIAALLLLGGCDHTHILPRTAQSVSDLRNRMYNAEAISDIVKRDGDLSDIAVDAAVSNQPELVFEILPKIQQPVERDKAAADCVKELDKQGNRPAAQKVIPLITDQKTRDDVHDYLADHAPPQPTTNPTTQAT